MKKGISIFVMAFQALSILYCLLSCIYTLVMGGGTGAQRGPAILCLAALAATVYYICKGHKKTAANAFKLMLLLSAAAAIMCLLPHFYDLDLIGEMPNGAAIIAIAYALCFGLYLVLALVPDLGKARSNTLIVIIFCIFAALIVFYQINRPGAVLTSGTQVNSMRIMRLSCMGCLALNAGTCNYFKYVDKASRGSK